MLMTSDDASGDASHDRSCDQSCDQSHDLPYWVSGHVTLGHVTR